MDPPELASEPPRSRIGAALNSARAFKSIGLGNVRVLKAPIVLFNSKLNGGWTTKIVLPYNEVISSSRINKACDGSHSEMGLCFSKGRGMSWNPLLASSPLQSLFNEGLSLKKSSKIVSGWRWRFHPTWSFSSSTRSEGELEVGATVGAFKSIKSQLTARIFLAPITREVFTMPWWRGVGWEGYYEQRKKPSHVGHRCI